MRGQGTVSDEHGNIWIANCGNGVVTVYPGGDHTRPRELIADPACGSSPECSKPFDIAFNRRGWAFVTLNQTHSVAVLRQDGTPVSGTPIDVAGLFDRPMGIAADSRGNMRLSHFCGRNPRACPPGAETGSPISPGDGYGFDGLTRNTGVAIDPSGNVWLANNWKNEPNPLRNPGGYEMVAFIGLAPPIATPLIGPPRRP